MYRVLGGIRWGGGRRLQLFHLTKALDTHLEAEIIFLISISIAFSPEISFSCLVFKVELNCKLAVNSDAVNKIDGLVAQQP